MRGLLMILVILGAAACGKKAADVLADAVVDCVLPCDTTPVDAADVGTPTEATATLANDVTP